MRTTYLLLILLGILCQSCVLHSSKTLYRKMGRQKITGLEISFADSINSLVQNRFVLDSSHFNRLGMDNKFSTSITATKRMRFFKEITNLPQDSMNTYLLIMIQTPKKELLIWPYYNLLQVSRKDKADAMVSLGRIVDLLIYSEPIQYQDKEVSNRFIKLVNETIVYQNLNGGLDSSSNKKTLQYLPLIQ